MFSYKMKMNYEHRSNIKQKKSSMPFQIVAVIILVLLILYFISPDLLSKTFTAVARPFWNFERKIKNPVPISKDFENSIIKELKKENMELKEMLGRNSTSTVIMAYVLKKPPFSAYDSFILDVGSKEGIEKGDKVYAIGDVLLGEIVEVSGPYISKAKLYSSYGEKYEVFIGADNIEATALGRGGGAFEITLPRDVKVAENDIITIPSLSTSVFGIVKSVEARASKTLSTILFSQPLNIYQQKWVEIRK